MHLPSPGKHANNWIYGCDITFTKPHSFLPSPVEKLKLEMIQVHEVAVMWKRVILIAILHLEINLSDDKILKNS